MSLWALPPLEFLGQMMVSRQEQSQRYQVSTKAVAHLCRRVFVNRMLSTVKAYPLLLMG